MEVVRPRPSSGCSFTRLRFMDRGRAAVCAFIEKRKPNFAGR